MQFHDSSWYVLGMLNRFSTPFWPIFGDVMMMWSCQDFSSFSDVCLGECPVIVIYWLVVYLPLWKIWVRQLGWLFPIYGKNKHVPNHQPVMHDLRDITDITLCLFIRAATVWTSWSVWFSFFLSGYSSAILTYVQSLIILCRYQLFTNIPEQQWNDNLIYTHNKSGL
jgi:hypothetical protein